jgi:tetratricopeptide (TPR) repeat protein
MSTGLRPAKPAQSPRPKVAAQDKAGEIWNFATDRLTTQEDSWFEDGDYPAAIQLLRVTRELHPNDWELVTNLGWMLENVQEMDEALTVYQRYEKDNPNDPDAALAIADYLFRRKDYAPIPALLESKIGPGKRPHPNNFRILAHAYEKLGKFSDAERIWKAYIAIAPGDGTAKNNLNRIEKKLGKTR